MNIIKLMGGLGNQIYQYAFGQAQAENGLDVFYDRSWFDVFSGDTFREYRLNNFPITVPFTEEMHQRFIRERKFAPSLVRLKGGYFQGYWQYLDYYHSILPKLIQSLQVLPIFYTPEYVSLRIQALSAETVALHVRRGDYLTTEGFSCTPLSYYFHALKLTPGQLFIFSDDIPWCQSIFKPELFKRKITFVELPDYLAFDLMRLCSHQIIANSTFSWWAAMLNQNPEKIVIYPRIWKASPVLQERFEKENHFPKNWIQL